VERVRIDPRRVIGSARREFTETDGRPSGRPVRAAGGTTGETTGTVMTPTPRMRVVSSTRPQQRGQARSTTSTSNQADMLDDRVRGGIRTHVPSTPAGNRCACVEDNRPGTGEQLLESVTAQGFHGRVQTATAPLASRRASAAAPGRRCRRCSVAGQGGKSGQRSPLAVANMRSCRRCHHVRDRRSRGTHLQQEPKQATQRHNRRKADPAPVWWLERER
jgi:hypothetical protein